MAVTANILIDERLKPFKKSNMSAVLSRFKTGWYKLDEDEPKMIFYPGTLTHVFSKIDLLDCKEENKKEYKNSFEINLKQIQIKIAQSNALYMGDEIKKLDISS